MNTRPQPGFYILLDPDDEEATNATHRLLMLGVHEKIVKSMSHSWEGSIETIAVYLHPPKD